MLTIHKYPFTVCDSLAITMPRGSQILRVDDQNGTACMWALVQTEEEAEVRHFRVFGTGHPIRFGLDEHSSFVETFQQGRFVWHVFEVATTTA